MRPRLPGTDATLHAVDGTADQFLALPIGGERVAGGCGLHEPDWLHVTALWILHGIERALVEHRAD